MILTFPRRRARLFPAPGTNRVAYIIGGMEAAEEIAASFSHLPASLVFVECADWNAALSPWPAPACFRGGEAFSGAAAAFLTELTGEILPAAEAALGVPDAARALVGVSLAGLFALWALFHTDRFGRAGSVSGSLWYDGFLDFMKANAMPRFPERVYLSLGDREEHTRNERLRLVGDNTRAARGILSALGIETTLEMNPGNHFVDGAARLVKALNWIYR